MPLSTLSTARPLPRSRKLLQDRGPSHRVGRHTGKVPPSGETSPGGKHTCPRSEKERERSGGSGYSRVPDTQKQPGLKSQRGDSNEMTVEGWLALQVLRMGRLMLPPKQEAWPWSCARCETGLLGTAVG